ncbi:MAG: hypothetical protein GY708_18755 [Actinomycetia bacterium]|nr:hypothetical protein [Actinomycetes bacterium]
MTAADRLHRQAVVDEVVRIGTGHRFGITMAIGKAVSGIRLRRTPTGLSDAVPG